MYNWRFNKPPKNMSNLNLSNITHKELDIDDFTENSIYIDSKNAKRLVRIPNTITNTMNPTERPNVFVHVFFGIWNSGKSTILQQLSLFARSKEYIVFFSKSVSDPNAVYPEFKEFNRKAINKVIEGLEKLYIEKKMTDSYLTVTKQLLRSTTNKDIINCLLGLSPVVPVCIIVDRWDLHKEDSPVYLAHNENCLWFLSGTGSWNPKSIHKRYPNNEYRHVEFSETLPIDVYQTQLLFNPILNPDLILRLSKGVIGYAEMIAKCNSEDAATAVLLNFFRDKVQHVFDKWIESKNFADISDLRKAAAHNSCLVGEKWKQIGFVDYDGRLVHELLRQSLLDYRLSTDELLLAMSVFETRTEDVFELYIEYLFAKTSSLRVSNFIKASKRRKLETPRLRTLNWTTIHLYDGDKSSIKDRIIYKLSFYRQFPSIDFVLLMDSVYYGIQVSVTKTREEHDDNESVEDRIKKAKIGLGLDENSQMEYLYLSMDQFKVATTDYFVPENARYLDVSAGKGDKCYLRLLELKHQ